MGRETVLRWTFVLRWYPFYLKYPCSVFHRRQKWQWDWWISTSVTGERQAFGDRRELSDGYGLGNLQLWVCFLYFRNKCWCHLYKEAGWLAWKRKEKLFWAGGAVDGGWGWPPLFLGGKARKGPLLLQPKSQSSCNPAVVEGLALAHFCCRRSPASAASLQKQDREVSNGVMLWKGK